MKRTGKVAIFIRLYLLVAFNAWRSTQTCSFMLPHNEKKIQQNRKMKGEKEREWMKKKWRIFFCYLFKRNREAAFCVIVEFDKSEQASKRANKAKNELVDNLKILLKANDPSVYGIWNMRMRKDMTIAMWQHTVRLLNNVFWNERNAQQVHLVNWLKNVYVYARASKAFVNWSFWPIVLGIQREKEATTELLTQKKKTLNNLKVIYGISFFVRCDSRSKRMSEMENCHFFSRFCR